MPEQTDLAALVKPLVWEDKVYEYATGDEYIAPTAGGYRISNGRPFGVDGFFVVGCGLDRSGPYPTEEAAKAAAQAEHEARTLSPMTVIDAKALVKAALERAATVVDRRKSIIEVGTELSNRIRALADDPEVVAGIVEQVEEENDE